MSARPASERHAYSRIGCTSCAGEWMFELRPEPRQPVCPACGTEKPYTLRRAEPGTSITSYAEALRKDDR